MEEGDFSRFMRNSDWNLTQEQEEDVVNNNDPNNNSSDVNQVLPDQNLLHHRHHHHQHQQQQQQETQQKGQERLKQPKRNSNTNDVDNSDQLLNDVQALVQKAYEEEDPECKAKLLQDDCDLIVRLMPNKKPEEVLPYLEAHVNNPSRVQIVLNEFLTQAEQQKSSVQERKDLKNHTETNSNWRSAEKTQPMPSPEVELKNKSGNGLKSKNSKKSKSSFEDQVVTIGGPKRNLKRPILSLDPNIDDDITANLNLAGNKMEGKAVILNDKEARSRPRKVSRTKSWGADAYDPGEGSSKDNMYSTGPQKEVTPSNTSRSQQKNKIELSETHFHGPFDFTAHRRKYQKQENKEMDRTAEFDSSDDIIVEKETSGRRNHHVVDLEDEKRRRSSGEPTVIDIEDESFTDESAAIGLLNNFVNMFPDTSREYLEEAAKDLVGKNHAIDRFVAELLKRNCQPPEFWVPKHLRPENHQLQRQMELRALFEIQIQQQNDQQQGEQQQEEGNQTDEVVHGATNPQDQNQERQHEVINVPDDANNADGNGTQENTTETEEEKIQQNWDMLQNLFPKTDPEFLHLKLIEMNGNGEMLGRWIDEGLENNGKDFPTKEAYEKRRREAEMLEKYSQEVSVKEILDMYPDPEAYFSDKTRKVSDIYKKHSLAQLKKQFRTLSANAITKVFNQQNCLFYPTIKELKQFKSSSGKRKTKRPDHECAPPQEIDINFLKELQFSRIVNDIAAYKEGLEEERRLKLENARKEDALVECVCCYNDECLIEEMLPCKSGHVFCNECVQRASEVAIGEGKTSLTCLGQCEELFELSTLQKALKPHVFSKWLSKIQIAEVEKADIEGLEKCPFCEFATIMETSPEQNKVFQCQNQDCGKESCRLCKEMSHIPLRCEEVEKDSEVRKRTYIENKMTEALIRICWSCKKPFVKNDGCNKMTCECGASMCYVCRKPVKSYGHFYGQGANPSNSKQCPLWSDNQTLHDNEVAKEAFAAKSEMDQLNPDIQLKHDPTAGVQKPPKTPPEKENNLGIDAIIGNDPVQRIQFIRQQREIENIIQGQRVARQPRFNQVLPDLMQHRQHLVNPNGIMAQMGQLLQGREHLRQHTRDLRRREFQALQDINRFYNGGNQMENVPAAHAPMIPNANNMHMYPIQRVNNDHGINNIPRAANDQGIFARNMFPDPFYVAGNVPGPPYNRQVQQFPRNVAPPPAHQAIPQVGGAQLLRNQVPAAPRQEERRNNYPQYNADLNRVNIEQAREFDEILNETFNRMNNQDQEQARAGNNNRGNNLQGNMNMQPQQNPQQDGLMDLEFEFDDI